MNNRTFLTIIAALLALHLAKTLAFIAAGQPAMVSDPVQYWYDGRVAAGGDLLLLTPPPEIIRTPGYPWFLALIQATSGTKSFIFATAVQQGLVLLTALLTGWMCWLATRSRMGVVVGLALSLACFSQNGVALYIYSDTLFCTLLALAAAMWIIWLRHALIWAALATGAAIGLATLVKPIAEFAFVPLVLVMLLSRKRMPLPRLVGHITCLCLVALLVGEPWRIRNQVNFGHPFLTKLSGASLWWSCFKQGPNAQFDPPLTFASDPITLQVTREAGRVDLASAWQVRRELMRLGHSEIEADDLMATVAKQAIQAQPWHYCCSRCRRYVWFWLTPNGTFRPDSDDLKLDADENLDHPVVTKAFTSDQPEGQDHWRSSWYFERGKLNVLWHPHVFIYGLAAMAVVVGLGRILSRREYRLLGISFALWFLYFSAVTVLMGNPEYRYRMILEPTMIVVVACACAAEIESRLAKKSNPLSSQPRFEI